jgi:DNA-binding MarR family transcriptional regulator
MYKTREELLESISLDLLTAIPFLYRNLRRKLVMSTLADVELKIAPLHVEIMRFLHECGAMPIARIGESLHVTKAQMTHLIDRLEELGMLERHNDEHDRRITNILLTTRGRAFIDRHNSKLKTATKQTLASLNDEELSRLSCNLVSINAILTKALSAEGTR